MTTDDQIPQAQPVALARRLAVSDNFGALFREGMALVEETAMYLDGDGREESRDLGRSASLIYATESMRLTTRLMQLASWLLLQRAVNEGEMTSEQALEERNKVRIDRLSTAKDGPGWEELPPMLINLVDRSVRLQERINHLDSGLDGNDALDPSVQAENPVGDQLKRLSSVFGGLRQSGD